MNPNKKLYKNLEIALGLLTGYLIAALVTKLAFDKTWSEAFWQRELIYALAGIGLTLFLIQRNRRKQAKLEEDED